MGACSAASNLLSGRLGSGAASGPCPWPRRPGGAVCPCCRCCWETGGRALRGSLLWGCFMYLLNTPAQMHALSLAEQDYPFASSLCASRAAGDPTTSALLSAPSSAAPCRRGGDPAPGPAGGNVRPGGTGAEPAASARQRPPDGRGGILRTIKTGSGRISPGLF